MIVLRKLAGCLLVVSALAGGLVAEARGGDRVLEIPLSIVGTDIGADANGVPNFLAGDLYLKDTNIRVGTYVEYFDLQFDTATGLPTGSEGISTFTFSVAGYTVGQIVTENQSFVVGFEPPALLLVESTGTIIDAGGIFDDVEGGIASCSSVILAPDFFALDANLILTLTP